MYVLLIYFYCYSISSLGNTTTSISYWSPTLSLSLIVSLKSFLELTDPGCSGQETISQLSVICSSGIIIC